ncbi:endo-1,4-beta-xylanase [Georgenia wangjunii]|uniref:endo-1,4-beta-xylanase n=1 Tax=Georgenia wangjunii TaxID=3117730 RepID=UPI002F2620ED
MSPFRTPPAPDPSLRHRSAAATLTVRRADGTPLADAEVRVEQTRHRFAFGNIGFDFIGYANGETEADPDSPFGGAAPAHGAELARLWLDVFNTATLPFYWAGFEPERGSPDTARLRRAAEWFVEQGAAVKGHPLAWHTLAPDWLADLPTDDVEEALRGRIRREVAGFAGVVDTWDAINEVVIMPVFSNEERRNGITRLCWERGRIATIRLAFEEARAANPSATLLLNDFNLSPAYECLIEGVLEAGIEVDALGLQSHMHQGYWGEEKTLEILERFSRFGLPLHLTESTLLSGDLMPPEIVDLNDYQVPSWPSTPDGEARQAEEMVRHYRTLLSHPSVEPITYWGLTDDGAWLGAPVGLVRADGTPKPSYDALRGLVKGEWWLAPTTLRTDAEGRVRVSGFLGDYALTAGGTRATFALDTPGDVDAEVTLPA